MIPFPGESIGLDFAHGAPDLYNSLRLRGGRVGAPPTQTIASGDEWRFWVYDEEQHYLEEPDADVVVSWVVEVVSGSATVAASTDFDPTYSDPGAAHTMSLGAVELTPGTVVLPTTFTAADVMAGGQAMMLVLECTAGAAEVQQVKLRVWPSSGVGGGWVTKPAWDTDVRLVDVEGSAFVARGTDSISGAREDAWNAAAAASAGGGAAGAAGPHYTSTGGATHNLLTIAGVTRQVIYPAVNPVIIMSTSLDGTSAAVAFYPHGVLAAIKSMDVDTLDAISSELVEGVDYIAPPGEVYADPSTIARWTGDRVREWVNPAITVKVSGEFDETFHVGPFMVGVTVDAWTTSTDPITGTGPDRTFNADMVDGGSLASSSLADTVTQIPLSPGDDFTVLAFSHAMASTLISWPGYPPFIGDAGSRSTAWFAHLGVGDPDSSDFAPMGAYVHMPPYEVWSPTAVTVQPLRLMQRGDGLGMGSGRVFGAGTRQASTRVFGAL